MLVKTISKTRVPDDYQFKMLLDTKLYPDLDTKWSNFISINDSTYFYSDKIKMEVDATIKNEFQKILSEEQIRYGTFVFLGPEKIKLIKWD